MPELTLDRLPRAVKSHEKLGLALGFTLQLGVLLALVVLRLSVLWTGETYYVHVVPVDPRDLLRGDYVILGYDFSRPPPGLLAGEPGPRDVYVTLVPAGDGKHSVPAEYLRTPPTDGRPFLKGRMSNQGRIEYGIESFFVQEGKGHVYEDALRSGRLSAEIAVTPDGRAALRGLHVR